MVRKIGKNGTVTLPKEIRVNAGLFAGNAVEIMDMGDSIVITQHKKTCRICGSGAAVRNYTLKSGNICICAECSHSIWAEVLLYEN